MTGQINIHDVARLANVSPTTVSNVLNERFERMRPATVERVMKAIEQLSYTPNRLAQQLKTGNVSLIGLIVPSVSNPFWGMVARNVEEVAHKYGYQLLLCNAERDPERERRYADVLWSSGVRGVIFGSSPLSIEYLTPLVEKGLQVIAFDRQVQSADKVVFDSVGVDNIFGAQLAVKHLLGLGHRRIGLLSGPMKTVSRLERLKGYQLALQEVGVEPDSELIWESSPTSGFGDIESVELGRKGAHVLLGRSNRPTALFTVNDMYALGAYAGARDLGLRVPNDVSIVGFDDLVPLVEIATPPLTTIRQPLAEMMSQAFALLLGRLEKTRTASPEHIMVMPELIIRASTIAR